MHLYIVQQIFTNKDYYITTTQIKKYKIIVFEYLCPLLDIFTPS